MTKRNVRLGSVTQCELARFFWYKVERQRKETFVVHQRLLRNSIWEKKKNEKKNEADMKRKENKKHKRVKTSKAAIFESEDRKETEEHKVVRKVEKTFPSHSHSFHFYIYIIHSRLLRGFKSSGKDMGIEE